ncbi:UDP-glucose 4-epimerase GalE [Pseudohoeflea coraliihabitans]|uniref:UDP-glucose 4-epimerase n=1 Tax=Pseudohoeflea coraliihabitans TaxID=2860393 RepID=A0ABS6WLN6_9HYPH|nr:UDP-glucose 4-epimerase GalE [Pseudohoeflea sp. DP4N28-3]MBW3096877.1 UDP-glucose 4-epimerase GalE [Pseudohoeflea sp. DP4N28-3]
MAQRILVTGGAGYIGSHTCVALRQAGYEPVIYDNFSNASRQVLKRLAAICGSAPEVIEGDVRDRAAIETALRSHDIRAVIHFAALKSASESIEMPLAYYDNNVHGTVQLLSAMRACNVASLVFSSSAAVYGDAERMPVREDSQRAAQSPYGRTKIICEDLLSDISRAEPGWSIARLRYFNPFGAHESGLIGEDTRGVPPNLGPYLTQVAAGQRVQLSVFGGDYDTRDGTGVRDFIHVVDLAEGHIAALRKLEGDAGLLTVNLGTGTGYTVLEMIAAFAKASGRPVPYVIAPRRKGDIAECYADVSRAREMLDWRARRGLAEMCADAWRWQIRNPEGYASDPHREKAML